MGKAFGNRKREEDRPLNDFYQTPKCMTWELINKNLFNKTDLIYDPCCGLKAIGNELRKFGYNNLIERDISIGNDYLLDNIKSDVIVMNPPFKLWDKFVEKAKKEANLICVIGKLNFFGSHSRNINGLWKHLKLIYIYDRQIAYDKPFREDGKVECGMLISGWFIWDMNYNGLPQIEILDMQKYILNKK